MRLHKPIGILLLLWPTLWALWLASDGAPNNKILVIFVAGTILMRSAGCIINDIADRHVDGHVERTKSRPLITGTVSVRGALLLAAALSSIAFMLVLSCNVLTIELAVLGAIWVVIYPLLKRVTHLPQVGLGIAFSWGVPMAYAATTNSIPLSAWMLFSACVIWPVIYDTMYAMTDREDDLQIGIKSTAILFGLMDRIILGLLQMVFLSALVIIGIMHDLNAPFYISIALVAALFGYQQYLIKDRDRQKCFKAFLNNNWVGAVIFAGIIMQ